MSQVQQDDMKPSGGNFPMKSSKAVPRQNIAVLVADSNQTQSQVLSSALRRQPGIHVMTCAADLSELSRVLASWCADVVLLMCDSEAEYPAAYEILNRIHSDYPKMRLVLVVDRYGRELVVNGIRSGARGIFCRATEPFKALPRCIYSVHSGQV
jgi:DNA-binding NarL/FixJ family response regulator